MKLAFSTVACPDWTLTRVAQAAERWGFEGVELRTFGHGSTEFACDPALSSAAKVRDLFAHAGVQLACLASSVRFDEPVTPPVIGYVISDTDRSVREAKGIIDIAVSLECPYVRVFGFEVIGSESRKKTVGRIAERLRKVCDHADKSGVSVLLENGGSFCTSAQVAEVIDAVQHPLLLASYSAAVGAMAGERLEAAANVLGERLAIVKVKDMHAGRPCVPGEGEFNAAATVRSLAGFGGWLVYEHDLAWMRPAERARMGDPDAVMSAAAKALYGWASGSVDSGARLQKA